MKTKILSKISSLRIARRAAAFYVFFCAANLIIFGAFRAVFYVKYSEIYGDASAAKIIGAFLAGLRFDASTISVFSSVFFLWLFISEIRRNDGRMSRVPVAALIVVFSFLWIVLAADLFYFRYSGRRMSFEIWLAVQEIAQVSETILSRYALVAVFMAVFVKGQIFLFYKVIHFIEKKLPAGNISPLGGFSSVLVFLVVAVVAGRGGFQTRPIEPKTAFAMLEDVPLGYLSLNGAYTVSHAALHNLRISSEDADIIPADVQRVTGLVGSPRESFSSWKYPLKRFRRSGKILPAGKKKNIVIFIMEGLSAAHTGALGGIAGATPFMDSLAEDGLLHKNFYSTGTRTMQILPAVLCSLPPFYDFAHNSITLEQNRVRSVAHVLGEHGYSSIFVHGARRDVYNRDALLTAAGFNEHVAMDDFKRNEVRFSKAWGVHDEYVFLRAHEEFQKMPRPFLGVVFSLSAHPPYDLPPGERPFRGHSLRDDFLNAVRYSDDSLKQFFSAAVSSDYYKDTIFIILGDHTSAMGLSGPRDVFRIPFVMVFPGGKPDRAVMRSPASQTDILPTIMDLAGVSSEHASFGRSLFDENKKGFAFMYANEIIYWAYGDFILGHDGKRKISLHYRGRKVPFSLARRVMSGGENMLDKMENDIKSFMRVGRGVVLGNRIWPPHVEEEYSSSGTMTRGGNP